MQRSGSPETSEPLTAAGEDEDAVLAARARVEPAAFAPLYARYVDQVYGYCLSRLGDPAEAEDATSLVFARALGALPRYQESNSFRSWLFTIAHNTIANLHRDRQRRPHQPLETAGDVADDRIDRSPEARAVAADERRALRSALARLAPDQRRVVELRLAGLSGPQIAETLGRTHAAVKMLQLRAVDRLQTMLATGNGETTREGPDAQ